ncbi:hypothetical protein LNP26_27610 [Klebsiella variicola subsp. variicola]|nr:hypothetical protein [Klebsiella variicola subsp. variicola]
MGVSRTPVRAGLKELTRMGAVEAQPSQVFLLKRSNRLDQLEIEQSRAMTRSCTSNWSMTALQVSCRNPLPRSRNQPAL